MILGKRFPASRQALEAILRGVINDTSSRVRWIAQALFRETICAERGKKARCELFGELLQHRADCIQVVLSEGCNRRQSWLDPLAPVPPKHLALAAEELGMAESRLRDLLAAEEEFLGWNPLEGAGAKGLGPPEVKAGDPSKTEMRPRDYHPADRQAD